MENQEIDFATWVLTQKLAVGLDKGEEALNISVATTDIADWHKEWLDKDKEKVIVIVDEDENGKVRISENGKVIVVQG